MARIYLAASYARKLEMREKRDWLVKNDLGTVTSRWIDRPGTQDVNFEKLQEDHEYCKKFAHDDLEDMAASNVFMMFTGDNSSTGGRHTEFGAALLMKCIKAVYIIGPRENVFQCICDPSGVHHFKDWETFTDSFYNVKEEFEFAKIATRLINEINFIVDMNHKDED